MHRVKWWVSPVGTVLGIAFMALAMVFSMLVKDPIYKVIIGYVAGAAMTLLVAVITLRANERGE
jgi:hypothetical protein